MQKEKVRANPIAGKGIVFFDGVCGLCNRLVDFLMRKDRKNMLLYAPLQGATATKYISNVNPGDLSTVVYLKDDKLLFKSDAILQILVDIGGFWKMFGAFKIVHRPLRNWVYDLIAKRRYKWFGQRESCRVPTPAELAKFLD